VGAPRKSLPQGASDVVTPLFLISATYVKQNMTMRKYLSTTFSRTLHDPTNMYVSSS